MRLVIADDHAVVRTGFTMLLNYQEDMEVVGTAADGTQAFEKSKVTLTRCTAARFKHAAGRIRIVCSE